MKILAPDIPHDIIPVTDFEKTILTQDVLQEVSIDGGDISADHVQVLDIRESRISKTYFSQSTIRRFELRDCVFTDCDFTAGKFGEASWHSIEFDSCRCTGMQLQTSSLRNVVFRDCKLDLVNFRFARLDTVLFENCVVGEMDFYNASLKNVRFVGSTIENITFSGGRFKDVDITQSEIISVRGITDMKGIRITSSQLYALAPHLATNIGLVITDD